MNEQDLLVELGDRGLRAWQATFVVSLLNPNSSAFQLLAAPPGTGKMYATVAAIRELAIRGATRMLILAPAYVCEAWRTRIGEAQSQLPVSSVTRREYREMEAAVPVGQSPWATTAVFVISQDLAKQPDIVAGLSMVAWDLVVVDEAHHFAARQRSALLAQLVSAGVVRRLLLLTATPLPALDHWLRLSADRPSPLSTPPALTSWYGVLKNWDGSAVERPRVDWEVVRYSRGADEVRFLAQLLEMTPVLEMPGAGNQFLPQLLIQRAASCTFAAEQSLQRLRYTLRSRMTNITAPIEAEGNANEESEDLETEGKMNPSTEADNSSALKLVEECLEALESVNTDEKLTALKALVRSIATSTPRRPLKVSILSMYADTVAYLYSALQDADTRVFKITGRDGFTNRVAIVDEFRRVGGLLVCTDGGSEGIELRDVTHMIHYDVPTNPRIMEQRRGRVDRYGRTAPCTMFLFQDDSGVIPFESAVIDRLTAVKSGDKKAPYPTDHVDPDDSVPH
jgi:superfamily II DNA or RNA helicase